MAGERKSVQVPVDIFDDLFFLFMLDDFEADPERVKRAIFRVRSFLREKKKKDVTHEYYSKHQQKPDVDVINEEIALYSTYLKFRK